MSTNVIDVMLDLETLGAQPGSVVLSIGACGGGEDFYARLPPLEQIFLGLTIDPDTMSWWRKQSAEAWRSSTGSAAALFDVLGSFDAFIMKLRRGPEDQPTGNKLRIWGDSSSFDCVLLKGVYQAARLAPPWSYTEEFCYRTLRTLANSEKPNAKLQHNALDDARAQLVHLQELLPK